MRIVDDEETIVPKQQIKILGWTLNKRMKIYSNLNLAIGSIHAIMSNLEPVQKYLNQKTRTQKAKCHMLNKLNFGLLGLNSCNFCFSRAKG